MWIEPTFGHDSDDVLNRRGLGKAKHADLQNMWIQGASKSKRFVTKKVGTNVNTAHSMTNSLLGPKIVRIRGAASGARRVTSNETGELTATCRRKFDRGVLAVGYAASGLLDGVKFVAEMFEQSSGSEFDMCLRRSVDT